MGAQSRTEYGECETFIARHLPKAAETTSGQTRRLATLDFYKRAPKKNRKLTSLIIRGHSP